MPRTMQAHSLCRGYDGTYSETWNPSGVWLSAAVTLDGNCGLGIEAGFTTYPDSMVSIRTLGGWT